MAIQTRTYSSSTDVVTGATILAAHLNTDLDKLYSLQNGNIDNDNIASAAAIASSKINASVFTAAAGKISFVDSTGSYYFFGGQVSITADGLNGYATVTLPVAINTSKAAATASISNDDSSLAQYVNGVYWVNTTTFRIRVKGVASGTLMYGVWAQTA